MKELLHGLAQAAQWLYLPLLLVSFAAALALLLSSLGELRAAFKEAGAGTLLRLGVVAALGLYLRVHMSGRYGLDGLLWEHLVNAQAAYTDLRFVNFLHPGGHSALVALAFLFGRAAESTSVLTMILDTLSIALVFFASLLLLKKEEISLTAALIYAVLPWQVFVAGMGLDVTSSAFFVLAAFLVLLASRELRSGKLLRLSLLLMLLAAQIRTENLVLLLFFLPVSCLRDLPVRIGKTAAALLGALLVPPLAWLLAAPVKYGETSSPDAAGTGYFMSLPKLAANLKNYVAPHFLSGDTHYHAWLAAAFAAGLLYLFIARRLKEGGFLLAWTGIWTLVYGSFWNGSQVYRYSTLIHPVLAVISACGVSLALGAAAKLPGVGRLRPAVHAAALLLLVLYTHPLSRLVHPAPIVFWPSVREFSAMEGKLGPGDCVLLQTLPLGRSENAKRLIGGGRTFLAWPSEKGLQGRGCSNIYYYDLREYAHPIPGDLRVYDRDQAALFARYKLETFMLREPLRVYKVK
ncbi:MAG TPA: hypothetical protein PKI19_12470 [Elusimicrobiales bacterium]|nr:hypothetical protein [Elusimicrobiales bacterium]